MHLHSKFTIVGDSRGCRLANIWQEALPQLVTGVQVKFIGKRGAKLNGTAFCEEFIHEICVYQQTHAFIWIGCNDLEQDLRGFEFDNNGRRIPKKFQPGMFNQVHDNLVNLNDVIRERTGVEPTLFQSLNRFECRNLMDPIDYNKGCMKFNNKIKSARWSFLRTYHIPAIYHRSDYFMHDGVHLYEHCYSDIVLRVYERYFLKD